MRCHHGSIAIGTRSPSRAGAEILETQTKTTVQETFLDVRQHPIQLKNTHSYPKDRSSGTLGRQRRSRSDAAPSCREQARLDEVKDAPSVVPHDSVLEKAVHWHAELGIYECIMRQGVHRTRAHFRRCYKPERAKVYGCDKD